MSEVNVLVEETRALIQEVEGGDTAHAAWIAIQDRVTRLCEDRSNVKVGKLLGKTEKWVRDVRKWNASEPDTSPFARAVDPGGHGRRDTSAAKSVLRDPEKRRELLESLPEMERLEIAEAAMEPEAREGRRLGKEQRAHRESKPNQDRSHVALIQTRFERVHLDTLKMIQWAGETTWTPDGALAVERMIDGAVARFEELRAAVQPDSGDWDEALARLGGEGA